MRILLSLILVVAAGCQPATSPEREPFDPAAVDAAARQAFADYVAHANAGEWDQALALYSDDPSFHWVEDGAVAYPSKAELVAAVESVYGSVEQLRLAVTDVRVLPLRADLAWLTARWEQSLTLASGQAVTYGGATTILLRREDGHWRFLSGHNSTFKPRGE